MIGTTEHAILVAHGDVHTRCELAFALRAAGFQTVQADTGAKALKFAEHVSAAVIHIHLPDLDGAEVCRVLRSRPETAQLPIIQLTGSAQEVKNLDDAAARSADGFMSTRVEHSVLKDRVIQLLVKKTERPASGF